MSRSRKTSPAGPPATRCAIYTRKSTEEGLEQESNSLDAQREAAEAYIASQKAEGWACLQDRYDDGGYSGADMERPALKRLLADIEAGQVACVVVFPRHLERIHMPGRSDQHTENLTGYSTGLFP